jgi:hypothetical protein
VCTHSCVHASYSRYYSTGSVGYTTLTEYLTLDVYSCVLEYQVY